MSGSDEPSNRAGVTVTVPLSSGAHGEEDTASGTRPGVCSAGEVEAPGRGGRERPTGASPGSRACWRGNVLGRFRGGSVGKPEEQAHMMTASGTPLLVTASGTQLWVTALLEEKSTY